jgi:dsRNA-specific ribonuclease
MVSNASLAHAALKAGLGPFLLTEPMTSRKWTVPGFSNKPYPPADKRAVSGKALADTLEALVGAAYVDGGMPLAWAMIHVFIPEVANGMPSLARQRASQPDFIMGPDVEEKVDRLIGYQFVDRSLVWEALTHPSWQRDLSTGSYQKLEFLGDAILDMIITDALYKHTPPLTEEEMTKAKAAVVNAHFLAFVCMEFGLPNNQICIRELQSGEFIRQSQAGVLELWRFMRHDNPDVSSAQKSCLERYQKMREPVRACLTTGNTYPWVSLAQLGAEKFYSDINESIIGALFIDSRGSIEQCEAFLTRIKILPYLSRILREEVMVEHPRSVLGRLAKSSRVEYNITRNAGNATLYDVSVVLNDEVLHRVEGCLSQEECVVTGADLAIATLRDRSSLPAASIVAEF